MAELAGPSGARARFSVYGSTLHDLDRAAIAALDDLSAGLSGRWTWTLAVDAHLRGADGRIVSWEGDVDARFETTV